MALLCVDASIVVSWLVPSQHSLAVDNLWLRYVQWEDEFVAPPLLYPETISAIRRLANRGLLAPGEAQDLVDDFLSLEIPTPQPAGMYARAYGLASRYRRSTVYDMCYLALADLLSCDLLTLDGPLYNVATADFPGLRLVER